MDFYRKIFIAVFRMCSLCVVYPLSVIDLSNLLKDLTLDDARPPIILIPGMMSTRLVAWKHKTCRGSDVNVQDVVWLNLQKIVETVTIDQRCWMECVKLGANGSDPDSCKLRPDEGISSIGELSPGNLYTPPATTIFSPLIRHLV